MRKAPLTAPHRKGAVTATLMPPRLRPTFALGFPFLVCAVQDPTHVLGCFDRCGMALLPVGPWHCHWRIAAVFHC